MDAAVLVDFCEGATEAEGCGERDEPGHLEASVDDVVLPDEKSNHDVC